MNIYLLLPLALGVTVVLQATLNRTMALQYGLASAVLLNAAVFFILSLGFFISAKYTPTLVPEFMRVRISEQSFSWLYLLPGLCGFFLVLGLPWAIQNIGPSTSFLLLIASQIVVSLGLEIYQSGITPPLVRILGALLVIVGAILVI